VGANAQQEELTRQTARQIANAIARRIGESVSLAGSAEVAEAEEVERRRNSFWGTVNYTRVVDDDLTVDTNGSESVDFDVDLYMTNLGYDRQWSSVYLGVAGTAAHAEFEGSVGGDSGDGSAEIVAITPYAAFLLTDNVFVTTLVGLNGAFLEGQATGEDLDIGGSGFDAALVTEVALNGILSRGNWRLSGKAGHRYILTAIPLSDSEFTSFQIHTAIVGGKVGYQIDAWQPYLQAQFERVIPEIGPQLNFLFLMPGFSVQSSDSLSVGLEGLVEVVNKETTTFGGQFNFRWKF
jgi:hypothetical protein